MDIIDVLINSFGDPLTYSFIFLIYVILTVLFLPIPVEIGLFNPFINPVLLLCILALGKGIGAFLVFIIGLKIRKIIKKISFGTPFLKKIITYCEKFVKKYGYIGLFIIMSIPLMIDSVSLYLFSLLNSEENGKTSLVKSKFVLINIFAGATRGAIILAFAYLFNTKLV